MVQLSLTGNHRKLSQPSAELAEIALQAHSRLAALLMDLKHNNRAVDVLERLDGLVKGSSLESADVARRLRDARLGARFDAADHYKLLGVDRTVCSEDVSAIFHCLLPCLCAYDVGTNKNDNVFCPLCLYSFLALLSR